MDHSRGRRISRRARLGEHSLFLNKYVDGFPHLAELLDVSESGMLIRTIREPLNRDTTFTLELGIPGSAHRMWLWAEVVRKTGTLQAIRIAHADLLERAQLRQLVRWNVAA
jgi:hypothetical protein